MYALLSLKPRYAEAILAGRKKYELRRRCPRLHPGSPVFLYATLPEMKVVGVAIVKRVVTAPLDFLWQKVKYSCEIDRDAFSSYFQGCVYGHAIELSRVHPLKSAIPLSALRRHIPRYQPPQFYHRFHPDHPLFALLTASLPEEWGLWAPFASGKLSCITGD